MSHAIDYFAVLGRNEGKLVCDDVKSSWEENKFCHPSEVWNDAITDFAVVTEHNRESLDETWEIIDCSVEGFEFTDIDFNIAFAIQRRRNSKREDHITEIRLISTDGDGIGIGIPSGFESISGNVCGNTDIRIAESLYFAVKRSDASAAVNIDGYPIIDDICLVVESEDEQAPEGYVVLDSNLVRKSASSHRIMVSYHVRQPQGLCNLSYKATTIDRYPKTDYKNMELPEVELPLFVFPHGLRLLQCAPGVFPLPVFYTFLFTDAKGEPYYAACLQFYEAVEPAELAEVCAEIFKSPLPQSEPPEGEEAGGDNCLGGVVRPDTNAVYTALPADGTNIYAPKVVCVLSKVPFYRAMRRYLRQLYSISLSVMSCPIEYFISSVVGAIPLPVPGGRSFHLLQDASLISETSKAMAPVVFETGDPFGFPSVDLDFSAPFRCLSVTNILAVFALLLREAKVMFICKSNTMLTEVMETFKNLLFPLTWSSCFISRLPDQLNGLLEAPGGFMIGIHEAAKDTHASANPQERYYTHMPGGSNLSVGSSKELSHNYVVNTSRRWNIPVLPGTYIVDLSSNIIAEYDGTYEKILNEPKVKVLVKENLPTTPTRRLSLSLRQLVTEDFGIVHQQVNLEEFDSAFELPSNVAMMMEEEEEEEEEGMVSTPKRRSRKHEPFPTLHVRDFFMVFMTEILGDYYHYVRPPSQNLSLDAYRTLKEEFAMTEYLNNASIFSPGVSASVRANDSKILRTLLDHLTGAQMFAVLLQQRSELHSQPIVFFEQASRLYNHLKALDCVMLPQAPTGGNVAGALSPSGGRGKTASVGSPRTSSGTGQGSLSAAASPMPSSSVTGYFDTPCCLYELVAAHCYLKGVLGGTSGVPGGVSENALYSTAVLFDRSAPLLEQLVTIAGLRQEHIFEFRRVQMQEHEENYHTRIHGAQAGGGTGAGACRDRHHSFASESAEWHEDDTAQASYPRSELSQSQPDQGAVMGQGGADVMSSLHLSNHNCGPLVLPGPASLANVPNADSVRAAKKEHEASNHNPTAGMDPFFFYIFDEVERNSNNNNNNNNSGTEGEDGSGSRFVVKYCYRKGWPSLSADLLARGAAAVHPRVADIRSSRMLVASEVSDSVVIMCRSHADRFKFRVTGRLLHPISPPTALQYQYHRSEKTLGTIVTTDFSSPPVANQAKVPLGFMLDTLHSSVLLLCLRILNHIKPVNDMLQILGLLAQLESISAIDYMDENVWRCIFVACAECGGDFMRRVACVVYEALRDCRMPLSAATFGQYQRALMAVKRQYRDCGETETTSTSTSTSTTDAPGSEYRMFCDSYVYLEEVGVTWFTQRIVLSELSHSLQGNTVHVNGNYNGGRGSISGSAAGGVAGSVSASPQPGTGTNTNTSTAANTPTKSGMFSSLFGGSTKNSPVPAASNTNPAADMLSPLGHTPGPRAAKAALLVARGMQLQSGVTADTGALVLLTPRAFAPISTYYSVGGSCSGSCSETDETPSGRPSDLAERLQQRHHKIMAEVHPAAAAAASIAAGRSSSVGTPVAAQEEERNSAADLRSRTSSSNAAAAAAPTASSGGSSWRDRLASMAGRKVPGMSTSASASSTPPPAPAGGNVVTLQVAEGVIYGNTSTPPPHPHPNSSSAGSAPAVAGRVRATSAPVSVLQLTAIAADYGDFSDNEEDEEESGGESVDSDNESLGEVEATGSVDVLAGLGPGAAAVVTPTKETAAPAPKKAVVPVHETSLLQQDILAGYSALDREMRDRAAVGIYCRTECTGCGFSFLEEETMCAWSGAGRGGLNVDETCEDIHTTHRLVCRQCRAEVTPMLHVNYFETPVVATDEGVDIDLDVSCKWSLDVPHLSPYGLRFELECLLLQVGQAKACSKSWLLTFGGAVGREVYWNSIWYAQRIGGGCPMAFTFETTAATDSDADRVADASAAAGVGSCLAAAHINMHADAATVVTAYRNLTLRAKLVAFFSRKDPVVSSGRVASIGQLLPNISTSDRDLIANLTGRCLGEQGGTAGDLRKLMLELMSLKLLVGSIMSDRCLYILPEEEAIALAGQHTDTPFARSRSLYVVTLSLVVLLRPNCRLVMQSLHELTNGNGSAPDPVTKQILYDGNTLAIIAKVRAH